MPRPFSVLALFAATVSTSAWVRAEHAKISLEVASRRDQVAAFVDQTPPGMGQEPPARPQGEGQRAD